MRGLIVISIVLCILCSCSNAKNQEEKPSVDEFSAIAKEVSDAHNARNSLDYKGTYSGILPSASGMGMDVAITLSDNTYVMQTTYVGKKDSTSEQKGSYKWNKEGNTITLEGIDPPNQYFVGENTLTQLDINGNRIKGELAEMYVLHKSE